MKKIANFCWAELVSPEDIVIDATCGNGHDTLILAQLNPKQLYTLDIQQQALDNARKRLQEALSSAQLGAIHFHLGCHSSFPSEILPNSVKLVVYNLGYLPGGDKSVTTQTETTLKSIQEAMRLLLPGGLVSITCYPGHAEGKREEDELLAFATGLPKELWSCSHHRTINRNQAPSLLLIRKNGSSILKKD